MYVSSKVYFGLLFYARVVLIECRGVLFILIKEPVIDLTFWSVVNKSKCLYCNLKKSTKNKTPYCTCQFSEKLKIGELRYEYGNACALYPFTKFPHKLYSQKLESLSKFQNPITHPLPKKPPYIHDMCADSIIEVAHTKSDFINNKKFSNYNFAEQNTLCRGFNLVLYISQGSNRTAIDINNK